MAEEYPAEEESKVLNQLRTRGYSVILFSPQELEEAGMDRWDLEDKLFGIGEKILENSKDEKEAEEDDQA